MLAFLNPLTAIASDALIYGTPVTPFQVIGMAMIAAATLAVKRLSVADDATSRRPGR